MTNTNCLQGISCPNCVQEDRFRIAAVISCLVTDGGSEPVGDHEWDGDSATHCPECGFNGKLKDFRKIPPLLPDPDGQNDDRAAWAGSAPLVFMQVTGTDEENALADLLADLMHWADRKGYDFDAPLERAWTLPGRNRRRTALNLEPHYRRGLPAGLRHRPPPRRPAVQVACCNPFYTSLSCRKHASAAFAA
jgi:hypothetical protein